MPATFKIGDCVQVIASAFVTSRRDTIAEYYKSPYTGERMYYLAGGGLVSARELEYDDLSQRIAKITRKPVSPLYKCQECGKGFKSTASARRATDEGCPKCGGSDIDLA